MTAVILRKELGGEASAQDLADSCRGRQVSAIDETEDEPRPGWRDTVDDGHLGLDLLRLARGARPLAAAHVPGGADASGGARLRGALSASGLHGFARGVAGGRGLGSADGPRLRRADRR